MIDIVLVHTSKSADFTVKCIDSINRNTVVPHKIIIVNGDEISPFCYNKALNYGAKQGNNPYILFCNNDLDFKKNWDILLTEMETLSIESASPYCLKTHHKWWGEEDVPQVSIGNVTGKHFAGWCFCWTRDLWNRLGLNEDYNFWCSDNITNDKLIKENIKHALIKKSNINHNYSKSLEKLDKNTKSDYTHGALRKYLVDKKDSDGLNNLDKQLKIANRSKKTTNHPAQQPTQQNLVNRAYKKPTSEPKQTPKPEPKRTPEPKKLNILNRTYKKPAPKKTLVKYRK